MSNLSDTGILEQQMVIYAKQSPFPEGIECDDCIHWRNGSCIAVKGEISPKGWCIIFLKNISTIMR